MKIFEQKSWNQRISKNYDFHIVQANLLNQILETRRTSTSILFHDYLYYDEEIEFLKKEYQKGQVKQRLEIIVGILFGYLDRYQNFTFFKNIPYFIDTKIRKLREKIIKRKAKAKNVIESSHETWSNRTYRTFIKQMNLFEFESQMSEQKSYQSSIHDIFNDFSQNLLQTRKNIYIPIIREQNTDNEDLSQPQHLIINLTPTKSHQNVHFCKTHGQKQLSKLQDNRQLLNVKTMANFNINWKVHNKFINKKARTIYKFPLNKNYMFSIHQQQHQQNQQHYDYLRILLKLINQPRHSSHQNRHFSNYRNHKMMTKR